MEQDRVKTLRLFFAISTSSFELVEKLNLQPFDEKKFYEMKRLHDLAYSEVNKENINDALLTELLDEMIKLSDGRLKVPNFESGGFTKQ